MTDFRWPILFAVISFFPCGASVADTIVVAPSGHDQNVGSREAPLRTISAGADRAMPGDTVLVLEGIYRERVAPKRGGEPGKRIVYRAEPGKRVIIKGSEVWQPKWRNDGDGVYSAVPKDTLFNDRTDEYEDDRNPFKVKLSSTPWERDGKREFDRGFGGDPKVFFTCGQVFVNGKRLREVPFKKELTDGRWFYDEKTGRIHIDFGDQDTDATKQLVEITTRRRIFAPQKRGLGYITVEGFIMEHCGNQYPTNFWVETANAQKGALGIEAGHHWIIRKNLVRFAKTFAIDAGYVDQRTARDVKIENNLIENNYIVDNGSAGILSNRSDGMVIRDNVILNNNTLRFFELKRWEQAGIKCHHFQNGHIYHNYLADNQLTYGIWLDNQFPDCRVSHNVVVNNDRAGIFLEMSDYGFDRLLIDHNIVVGNGENQVYIHDASGATFAHNLFANTRPRKGRGQAVFVRQVSPRTKTYHHSFYNNLFVGNDHDVEVNYPSHRSGPQRFGNNVYDGKPESAKLSINMLSDKPSPWSRTEFLKLVSGELELDSGILAKNSGEKRVNLTLQQWQKFWQAHDYENDLSSRFNDSNSVRFDPEAQKLTIDLGLDPSQSKSTYVRGLSDDFFGKKLGQMGRDQAGPFQHLIRGENILNVWSGMPILKPGELPNPSFNQ